VTRPHDNPLAEDLSALTFEQLVEGLENLTRAMADGSQGIEVVADLYERAMRLHAEATARLERVRQRIESLQPSGESAKGS